MDTSNEKKWLNEVSSSKAVLIDGPIYEQPAPAQIRHYFIFSLFSAIFLCPATGLIALAYSIKSSAKADVQFHEKSRLYSRRALIWNLISVILAVLSFNLALIFCYRLNEIMNVANNQMNSPQRSNDINKLIEKLMENK